MKKLATNTGVIMLAIIAVSGVTILFNFDEIFTPANEISKTTTGSLFTGNVEVIKRDGAGNIVAYRQGDNHIVLSGMELIARQVFGPGAAGSNNTNITSAYDAGALRNYGGGTVQYMSIGNGTFAGDCVDAGGVGTAPVLGFDNMTLECPLFDLATVCLREQAVINRFNASDTIPSTLAAQLNLTAVATFSGAAPNECAAQNIGEAGIWTNITGGPSYYTVGQEAGNMMFARNTFGTVNLSISDSLELTWKFTFTDN